MSIKKDEKLNEKAKKYMAHGQYEKAIEILEKIQETELPEVKYINLGICYRELKEFNKAIECCNKALQIGIISCRSYMYNSLGNIYSRLNERKTALIFYEQAFYLNSKSAIIIYNLACKYYSMGEIDKTFYVLSFLDEKLLSSKKYRNIYKKETDTIYEFLGALHYWHKKDYKKAMEYYLKIKKIDAEIKSEIWCIAHHLGITDLLLFLFKMPFANPVFILPVLLIFLKAIVILPVFLICFWIIKISRLLREKIKTITKRKGREK